jgi:aminomethyltransferase
MVDFAGYLMPVQYSGIIDEHCGVRAKCGIFDVSHMGEFFVHGTDAESFLDMVTVGNVSSMKTGDAQYSLMCNPSGGIIDDLLIYKKKSGYMLVVNASNIEKDFAWLSQNAYRGTTIRNISEETGLIAVQGPQSRAILNPLLDFNISTLGFYTFTECSLSGYSVTLARTGYSGELGYEIYCFSPDAPGVWGAIFQSGGDEIIPAGLGSRDTLRMEMKYCLYGNDIDENKNPIEAGLKWTIHFDKPQFIGKEAIQSFVENPKRRLVCIQMTEKAVPRKGYTIWKESDEIGIITSGTMSPTLGKGIGIGYVSKDYSKNGTEIVVDIRGKKKSAEIVKNPFYRNGTLHA